jgi:hypothetical protein
MMDLKSFPIMLFIAFSIISFPSSARIDVAEYFFPSGTMGDWADISLEESSKENPKSGPDCIKITYSAAQSQGRGFAGICWQYPDTNMGNEPGRDLTGITYISFWARGSLGGEVSEFSVGGGQSDSVSKICTSSIELSKQWQQYTLDLSSQDLSSLANGFCVVMTKDMNPTGSAIYLDDIFYE